MKNFPAIGVRWLVLALALTALTALLAASSAASQTRKLIFDQEFNGPAGSAPGAPWTVVSGQGFWTGQCWAPQNASETGTGYLSLTATYVSTGNACGDGNYESGAIQVPASAWSYRYGTAQASIKVPCLSGNGLWPSFWQYTSQNQVAGGGQLHKGGGEIDTMELMDVSTASDPAGTLVSESLHSTGLITTATVYNSNWCGTFHTFGNTWTPSSVTFTVDGVTEHTFNRSQFSSWLPSIPQAPVLSLLVGYYGGTASFTSSQTMLVDWVKIWG
jgi:beta-glucanase (GH16 family)